MVGGEKREVDALKLLGSQVLNERDFVAHRLQLAERLIVIEQLHVQRREVAVIEDLGNFLALERGSAHDGNPVKVSASGSTGVRGSNGFRRRTHGVCETSL